uniref:DUF6451 domain-containing protein n=1 Tax=Octopus bimaculoides TaxID=37653 RepID=A0A0L8G751_OCTBM
MKNVVHTMTERLEWEAAKIRLCISANKMKIMRIGCVDRNNNDIPLMIGQHQIKEVDEFTYLASIVVNDGDTKCDVACQIGKALAVFQRLKPIWAGRAISTKTKVHLFNSIGNICGGNMEDTDKDCTKAQCISITMPPAETVNVIQDHITNDEVHR